MGKQPYELGAVEASRLLREGRLSVRELVDSCLERIAEFEPWVGAWVKLKPELARERADILDGKLRDFPDRLGPLFGLPVGVKDIFNTEQLATCMGSPIWEGFTPGNDARVVSELCLCDAVIMGKTVTAEFAVHYPGKTVNPHDPERSPGTSSSGSAAAVATSMVPLALGTQTAGSTIRPASFTGIYGYKPSFGLIPRTGILKTLDTLDHVTFFARHPEDLRLIMDSTRVRGRNYPFVHDILENPAEQAVPARWKVGFVRTHVWDLAEGYVQQAMLSFVDRLRGLDWVQVEEMELPPDLAQSHHVHETIYTKSLSYYFSDEYREQRDKVSPVMQDMVLRGRDIPVAEFHSGLRRQNELAQKLDQHLAGYDVVISHSTAHVALKGLHSVEQKDPCLMWTLCRVPALNLPVFTGPQNLPFGLQAVARRYRDYRLLEFARRLAAEGLAPEAPNPAVPARPATRA
jgi:Asp-tRNA(Asn)/Glu-tRNA(Gln) amidotransferase A subunit family amidase